VEVADISPEIKAFVLFWKQSYITFILFFSPQKVPSPSLIPYVIIEVRAAMLWHTWNKF
jgi:hypothetical protein